MEWRLVVAESETKRKVIPVTQLPFVIGRGHECDLQILNPAVSRKHCELVQDGTTLLVRDLSSTNGTFIGQRRVQGLQPLDSDHCLTVGFIQLYLEETSIPEMLAPATFDEECDPMVITPVNTLNFGPRKIAR